MKTATLTSRILPLPSVLGGMRGDPTDFYLTTPRQFCRHSVLGKVLSLTSLVWKMILNFLKIGHKNTDFIYTTHDK